MVMRAFHDDIGPKPYRLIVRELASELTYIGFVFCIMRAAKLARPHVMFDLFDVHPQDRRVNTLCLGLLRRDPVRAAKLARPRIVFDLLNVAHGI